MTTILVVEEDTIIRGLIRVVLEGAGYRVLEASDGDAGFRLAQRNAAAHALIVDCMGARSGGIPLLRHLRGTSSTAHLPVIALCGLGQSGAEVGLWANSLVVKPFRPAQLLMKVEMVLASRSGAAPTPELGRPRASA